jgi:hypothetical protein
VHPSELPNFERIPVYDASVRRRRHRTPAVLVASVAVLSLAAMTLALHSTTPPASSALPDHIAKSISDLPSYAQNAARSAIELEIADATGHLSTAAAMVIDPGNLAVTTEPIPPDATITGSSARDHHFPVSLVVHDRALGFTVLHLAKTQQIAPVGVLPASSGVLAISPYFVGGSDSPEIAYAPTVLGDPVREQADGIVSYLATPSAPNLRGFVDTLAIDGSGHVVAVLSSNNEWYSAEFVAKVARVISANGGCHGRLGIAASSAQGGGVFVNRVESGPSVGHLRAGDILLDANGVALDGYDTLLSYLYTSTSHEGVMFHLLRGGHPLNVGVVLGCQP